MACTITEEDLGEMGVMKDDDGEDREKARLPGNTLHVCGNDRFKKFLHLHSPIYSESTNYTFF